MERAAEVKVTTQIRDYCKKHYVLPAREKKELVVAIRSGVVHEALGFRNRLPAVCAVLGSHSFEKTSELTRLAIDGPLNGASTLFVFKINLV